MTTLLVSRGLGLLAILMGGLILDACTSDAEPPVSVPPLPLDERLPPGRARAGLITKDSELIGGPTARGRAGDYKIYNDRISLIIGRAGLGRGYNPYGGTILDADWVRPAGEPGGSEFGEILNAFDLSISRAQKVEVVSDGSDGGEARIRVTGEADMLLLLEAILSSFFTPPQLDMEWVVDYVLEPNQPWLRVEQTLWNRSVTGVEFGLEIVGVIVGGASRSFLEGYGFRPPQAGVISRYYGALGDGVSYLYGRPGDNIELLVATSGVVVSAAGAGLRLRARERLSSTHYLIVGDGDLSRTQELWRNLAGEEAGVELSGRVLDDRGVAVSNARVHVRYKETEIEEKDYVGQTTTDESGRYILKLDPGDYELIASTRARIVSAPVPANVVRAGPKLEIDIPVASAGILRYSVVDELERDLPVKLSVRPEGRPVEQLPGRYGESNQGYGLIATEFAHTGRGTLELPAGDYTVFASRGGEYEMDQRSITLSAGAETVLDFTLIRSVSSPGWLTTDTHIHAQMSPDSSDAYPMKVRAMVVENLEIPVSTEHEAIGDFNPAIRELGLERWMQGIIGSEVTTTVYGHFNAFPLVRDFDAPGNGRIDWYRKKPAETFAAIRANAGDPFIQANHPRAAAIGGYFSAMGYEPSDFTARRGDDFSLDFDGIEVMNGCGNGSMAQDTVIDWFGFLEHGHKKYATGSTDNHSAVKGDMGFPLTYVRMPTDEPSEAKVDDVRRAFKEGRLVVSCGPFLEMKIGDKEIGDTLQLEGDLLRIDATVGAPSWMDVDELDVVVNGQVVKRVLISGENPERFSGTITASVPPGRDGWVILWARGNRPHGVWARGRPSFAFTNPIFIDGDGDGRWK